MTQQTQKLTVQELEQEVKRHLREMQRRNPRFSVRNFAIRLGVLESTLQKVMRGERRLGYRVACDIAKKYGVELTKEKVVKRRIDWKISSVDTSSKVQVSWLNFAILEMIKLDDFRPDSQWIAMRIGVDVEVIEKALDDMEFEGMLSREEGVWRDLLEDAAVAANGAITSETLRGIQKELLQLSAQKVESVPYEHREHMYSIFPISRSQLPKLKKKIMHLNWQIADAVQKSKGKKDEIYALQVGFFPLTQGPLAPVGAEEGS